MNGSKFNLNSGGSNGDFSITKKEYIGANRRKKKGNSFRPTITTFGDIQALKDLQTKNKSAELMFTANTAEGNMKQRLIKYLLNNTLFIDDMFHKDIQNQLVTLFQFKKINTQNNGSYIRLEQLYSKFRPVQDFTHISEQNIIQSAQDIPQYKLSHYLDNLLFAEYLSQILGIGGSNEIIIENKFYKIYVCSIIDDIRKGVDIILENEKGGYIGIDITSHKEKIGYMKKNTHPFDKILIANYIPFIKDFKSFLKDYDNYIFNKGPQIMLDQSYSHQKKLQIEKGYMIL